MFPLSVVTYEILHEINIDLLRLHTTVMYINVLKNEDLKAQFINEDLHAQFIYHEKHLPPCRRRGVQRDIEFHP